MVAQFPCSCKFAAKCRIALLLSVLFKLKTGKRIPKFVFTSFRMTQQYDELGFMLLGGCPCPKIHVQNAQFSSKEAQFRSIEAQLLSKESPFSSIDAHPFLGKVHSSPEHACLQARGLPCQLVGPFHFVRNNVKLVKNINRGILFG